MNESRTETQGTVPALHLAAVKKAFGATEIIRGVNWDVAQGECHVLIGPNGAGKSTLFGLISGHLRPSSGHISLCGTQISRLSPSKISRSGLGRSFQTNNLFARMSAFENVRIGALRAVGYGPAFWRGLPHGGPADLRALEVLDEVGLLEKAHVAAGLLSYADQRALEIAMAIAGGQQVLLFDEPTAGMNREETARVIGLLQKLRAGDARRTIVIIEHDMNVVFELADRISVLVYGELIATDTPSRIRANRKVQEAYLGVPATLQQTAAMEVS